MRTISMAALGVALALGASMPAAAQDQDKAAAKAAKQAAKAQAKAEEDKKAKAAAQAMRLSKPVRDNLSQAQTQLTANDLAGASASVATAQAAATNPDEKYFVAVTKLRIANQAKDQAGLATAIDEMIASGAAPAADLPNLYQNQGALAVQSKNYAKAEQAYVQLAAARPDDADALISLAEIKKTNGKTPEALDVIDKAVAAKKASGQPVPETWYRRAFSLAYDAKLKPQYEKAGAAWITAYPTPTNWRDIIQLTLRGNSLDDGQTLDLYRLARLAKALNGERDYYDYANTAVTRGLPGEANAVITQGVAEKMIDPANKALNELKTLSAAKISADKASLPASETRAKAAADGKSALNTADAYLGYGDYAKAAALYKVALTKGGVDANVVNTRLGIALGQSGQKAEALQSFAAVTGARKMIADLWTIYLNQQA